MPWFLGNSRQYASGLGLPLVLLLAAWSVCWTGLALWHSAKRNDKGWFVAFLFIHTAGILEIIYLAFVAKTFDTKKPKARK